MQLSPGYIFGLTILLGVKTKLLKKPNANTCRFHPEALIHNISTGQYLWPVKIAPIWPLFNLKLEALIDRFAKWGYKKNSLYSAYQRVRDSERELLMFSHEKQELDIQLTTRLSFQYTNLAVKARGIGEKYWHVLANDESVSKFVAINPQFVFIKACSLGDLLIHSDVTWKPINFVGNTGMKKHGSCDFCHFIVEGDVVTLSIGRSLRCRQRVVSHTW